MHGKPVREDRRSVCYSILIHFDLIISCSVPAGFDLEFGRAFVKLFQFVCVLCQSAVVFFVSYGFIVCAAR